MINYLRHHQIDKTQWDHCIDLSPDGNIYAYSWYLDLISPGWDALVEDEYRSVMPVTKGKKYLMNYIYPPFFAQQLGVFSRNHVNRELCEQFLNKIPVQFRFVEMNLNISNQWVPVDFNTSPRTDLILDISSGYETVRNNYSENLLRNLKKAEKAGLVISNGSGVNEIIEMFRNHRGRFIPNLQSGDYQVLLNLVDQAAQKKMVNVLSVHDSSGHLCAGAIFFESHETGIFIFSATDKTGKDSGAMHFLIDYYIRNAAGKLKRLDFEGSMDTDLARFYRSFGASEYVYLQIKKNQLPPPWSWFKN